MTPDILIPIAIVGLAASVLTEILKLFPSLTQTDEKKRIVAFAVSLVVSLIYIPTAGTVASPVAFILGVLSATFVIYKAIIQPIENAVNSVYRLVSKSK